MAGGTTKMGACRPMRTVKICGEAVETIDRRWSSVMAALFRTNMSKSTIEQKNLLPCYDQYS